MIGRRVGMNWRRARDGFLGTLVVCAVVVGLVAAMEWVGTTFGWVGAVVFMVVLLAVTIGMAAGLGEGRS